MEAVAGLTNSNGAHCTPGVPSMKPLDTPESETRAAAKLTLILYRCAA